MNKQYFVINPEVHSIRQRIAQAVFDAPDWYCVEIKEKNRTSEQNSLMWALLSDISSQVEWYGRKLSAEDWKHVFSSALKKQDVVPNIDGNGFVVLGQSTSKMGKREFSDMIELINSFGSQRGVVWSNN